MMMSLGITDVIILTDDATATFVRITNVSQTMTFAQYCDRVTTAYLSYIHHWDANTDGNLARNQARISTLAQKIYTMRTERANPQRTNHVN
jgi:hypothetical protein